MAGQQVTARDTTHWSNVHRLVQRRVHTDVQMLDEKGCQQACNQLQTSGAVTPVARIVPSDTLCRPEYTECVTLTKCKSEEEASQESHAHNAVSARPAPSTLQWR